MPSPTDISFKFGTQDAVLVAVTGDKEINKALRLFEAKVQKKFLRTATRKSVKDHVLPDARRLAPVKTGKLRDSLTVRATKRSRTSQGHAVATGTLKGKSVFTGDTFYGQFVELGTIRQIPRPFMRVALKINKRNVMREFTVQLKKAIKSAQEKKWKELLDGRTSG